MKSLLALLLGFCFRRKWTNMDWRRNLRKPRNLLPCTKQSNGHWPRPVNLGTPSQFSMIVQAQEAQPQAGGLLAHSRRRCRSPEASGRDIHASPPMQRVALARHGSAAAASNQLAAAQGRRKAYRTKQDAAEDNTPASSRSSEKMVQCVQKFLRFICFLSTFRPTLHVIVTPDAR